MKKHAQPAAVSPSPPHKSLLELIDEVDELNAKALGVIDTARQCSDIEEKLRNALWAAQDMLEESMRHQRHLFEVALQRPAGGE